MQKLERVLSSRIPNEQNGTKQVHKSKKVSERAKGQRAILAGILWKFPDKIYGLYNQSAVVNAFENPPSSSFYFLRSPRKFKTSSISSKTIFIISSIIIK